MIRVNDIEQGSIEWHETRYGKIGGSTSKGLFTKGDALFLEVLSSRLEDFEDEDSFISSDMQRGNKLEPYARLELNKYTNLTFNEVGWLQCEDIPLLGISPDGITDDDLFSCEIKCPAKKKHTETILNGVIPLDNLHQCVHYFTVNPKLVTHYFVSFRPENKVMPLFVSTLTRDSEVNLGTAARPVIKTVEEWVAISRGKAIELQLRVDEAVKELEF